MKGANDPVAVYDELLESDAIANRSAELLQEGQQKQRLVFGDRPVSITLRPQLVDRRRYDDAVAASQAIYGAFQRLERSLLEDAALRRELDLQPEEEQLALADPGAAASSTSSRIDGFFSDRLRFVEYNAESPAGMAYNDQLIRVFERLPVMRAFRRRFKLRALPLRTRQLRAMLKGFQDWGRAQTPVVAIIDWTGLPTTREFELFRDFFSDQGIRTVITDPASLEFRRGTLYASGEPVNLVYRRVLTSELLQHEAEGRPLRDAYLAGAVCVLNTFRAKLLHKKMSLALLSDDRYAHLYTPAQRRAIAMHIPWTRKMRPGPTARNGTVIDDLPAYVAEHAKELVLKPNDEYGGKGVVLGWTVSSEEWNRTVASSLEQSYVVQEAVPIPKQRFPVVANGIRYVDFAMDMNPYLFAGRACGWLSRLSSSELLNVTGGAGSVAPSYIIEGEA
ncbi:MAG TPA: hypothetical protein VNA65_03445 [Candidatus Dormibacteraeota bacterium]|nr:hypothetical protein [Candidatus Dormibacteraeota bacterium]